jgi:signal transduction histidine kinase
VDAVQIQQVLVNLIRNAVEVLGSSDLARRVIHVAARYDAQGDVEIEVGDTGPGMAEDVAEKLFHPFSTNKAEGMGLGLSISRTIIDAHGGRLWLAASGPDGCSFRFTLPKPSQHG